MADETRTIAWRLTVETQGIEQNTAKAASSLSELTKGAKFLQGALATIVAGTVARTFMEFSDTLTRVENDIRKVSTSTEQLDSVQRKLTESAKGSYTSLETTAANYRSLQTSLQGYGRTTDEVIKLSDTITKAVKLQGGSAADAEGAIKRLGLAFAQGSISLKQLNTMVTETPELVAALENALGKTYPQLQQMAKQGGITGKALVDALVGAAQRIDDEFANRFPMLAESLTNLKTSFLTTFQQFEKSTGFVKAVAKAVADFGNDIEHLAGRLAEFGDHLEQVWETTKLQAQKEFDLLLAYIKKILADIAAAFASLIPDLPSWVPGAEQLSKFKAHMTGMADSAKSNLKVIEDSWNDVIAATNDYYEGRRALAAWEKAHGPLEFVPTAQRKEAGKGTPGTEQDKASADAFAKALANLRSEQAKTRDTAAALSIEIRDGSQAAKEYTIQADARRKVEEVIQGLQESGKQLTAAQEAQLRGLSATVAKMTIEAERYANAWGLVKAAIDAGMTPSEKAAETLEKTEKAFADLQARGELSAKQIEYYNRTIADLKEKADPAYEANKQLRDVMKSAADEVAKLKIQMDAQAIALTQGELAAKNYTIEQEALLEVQKKVRDAQDARKPLDEAQIADLTAVAQQTAAAKSEAAAYADTIALATDAVNFGRDAHVEMRKKIDETRKAMEELMKTGADPKLLAEMDAGIKRMEHSISRLGQAADEIAYKMGSAFVDWIIDADQSFAEFAANMIKGIGRIIAQLYMQMAVEAMLKAIRGYAKGGVFESGKVIPFQHGGVVGSATTFPLAHGRRGLMGEAGPEAVMPLARLPGGDLGVKSAPMNLEVINNTGVNATARVRQESDRTQLILEAAELGATMAQSRFNSSVTSGYGASATTMQRTYGLTRRRA